MFDAPTLMLAFSLSKYASAVLFLPSKPNSKNRSSCLGQILPIIATINMSMQINPTVVITVFWD